MMRPGHVVVTGGVGFIVCHVADRFLAQGHPVTILSPLELVRELEELLGKRIKVGFSHWRPGDQKVYISDIRKAQRDCGWTPRTDLRSGLGRLIKWVQENQRLLASVAL